MTRRPQIPLSRVLPRPSLPLVLPLVLAACAPGAVVVSDAPLSAIEFAAPPPPAAQAPESGAPRLIGRGFSQIAGQPGATLGERRLLAMRAARLEALRDLTEQVHGIRITSDSLLGEAVLRNDRLAARVQGTLRGARTVSIQPKGDDGYEVVMELASDSVARLLRAAE